MFKRTGEALVAILIVIAALVVGTGVVKQIWPAEQLSSTAQYVIDPKGPVQEFPFTTLGSLKNSKVKLDVTKATINVVDAEVNEKIGASQSAYDSLIGDFKQPGILGLGLFATISAIGTHMYDKSKMYSVEEVRLVEKGEHIL